MLLDLTQGLTPAQGRLQPLQKIYIVFGYETISRKRLQEVRPTSRVLLLLCELPLFSRVSPLEGTLRGLVVVPCSNFPGFLEDFLAMVS